MPADPARVLDLATARALLDALVGASRRSPPLACAIVDTAAHVILLQRDPRTPFLTAEIALSKARAAVLLGLSTALSQGRAEARPTLYATLEALSGGPMVHLAGGLPIVVESVTLGAIGISGDAPERDEQHAQQAIDTVFSGATG